jgi:hypothetical protein
VPHEFGVQVITSLPLAYICVCTYFALFRLNAFDYNKLLPRWVPASCKGVDACAPVVASACPTLLCALPGAWLPRICKKSYF